MKIYDNKILTDSDLVQKLRSAAKIYAQYVDRDVLIVYAQSKRGPFQIYEFHAGKENFQHLAGIKSPNGASSFFQRCLDDTHILTRKEIVPKENIKVTSAKIAVLENAVDLTKSKAYKLGKKDLVTLHNNFDMAIGNTQAIMGFMNYHNTLPIPMTVMDRSIFEFCSTVSSIYLICTKTRYDEKYSNIFYEISKDILKKAAFADNVMSKIDIKQSLEYSPKPENSFAP